MTRDERPHAAAVKAKITAEFGPHGWAAYDYDEVPGTPLHAIEAQRTAERPEIYVAVTVERRFGGTRRGNGAAYGAGWRITARGVGTTVDEARYALAAVAAALEDQVLTVDGRTTTPVRFESSVAVEPDDGMYSGLSLWTFVH